jgi:hypothetical protein
MVFIASLYQILLFLSLFYPIIVESNAFWWFFSRGLNVCAPFMTAHCPMREANCKIADRKIQHQKVSRKLVFERKGDCVWLLLFANPNGDLIVFRE